MTFVRSTLVLAAATVFLTSLGGCVSTKKRFERGVKAEQEGRYEEAAGYYIQVLQKEPDWEEARDGLRRTGAIVIENHLAEADRFERDGRFVESADMLDRTNRFVMRANAVGAGLSLPDDFQARRERMADRAVEMLLRDADRARAEGRWSQALALYDQALSRGRLSETEVSEVRESRALALAGWADHLLRGGRYKLSFDKAQQALDLVGMEHPLTNRLTELQAAALEAGTAFVAMLPVAAKEEVRRHSGSLFLTDLNDILVYDYWAVPPPFILVADPVEVRRELRARLGRSGRIITRSEAADVGRAMDADWVFTADLVRFDRVEREKDRDRIRANTRGRSPLDTTYVLRKVNISYHTRADIRIYDVRTGRELYSGPVDASADEDFERGEYAGDYRDLDLSGRELSYFDPEEIRAQEDHLEEMMADRLAAKLAERVYSRMVGWIP